MDRLLLRIPEAAAALGISRAKLYSMLADAHAEQLPVVRVGGSMRIPAEGLRAWVQQQTKANNNSGAA